MFEPLSINELMRVNRNVLKEAEKIHEEYKRVFLTDKKSDRCGSLLGFAFYPLLIEAELYYNGELLNSYAIFKSMYNNKIKYRICAYYFENLIFRIISFWEYIYQFINQYLFLQLYDYKAKSIIIEKACYNIRFVPHERGTRVEYDLKPEREQKEIKKQLNKQIRLINQGNIVSSVYKMYEVKGNIKKLMDLISNNNIELIKEIRNQIIHQRPAGASFSTNFDAMFSGYSMLINNNGWVNFKQTLYDVQVCIDIIRETV